MPGTFSQIYIQVVFAVRHRHNLIQPSFEEELYQYISGIVTGKGQKSLAVNGMPGHIHVLVGLKPVLSVADLVRDVKNNTSNFINKKGWLNNKFSWQEGYGAFSYSASNYGNMIDYIKKQKHTRLSFRQEYMGFLKKYNLPYENKYLFDFYN